MELIEAQAIAADALASQIEARESGFVNPNPALSALGDKPHGQIIELVKALRQGSTNEREVAARLLAESTVPNLEKYELATNCLFDETHPEAMPWWLRAVQQSRQPEAITVVKRLLTHPDAAVRDVLPDILSFSAEDGFDHISDLMLALSTDADDGVRWSALYELTQWSQESDDRRIVERLETASDDPSPKIQELVMLYRTGGLTSE